MENRELGKRFSHVYLNRGEPEKDSKKARFRLAKLVKRSCQATKLPNRRTTTDYDQRAQEGIENELGINFATRSSSGVMVRSWEWYFNKISVTEMLDSITVIASSIHNEYAENSRQENFIKEASRILREENLAYEIDTVGGVHPLIDAAFSAATDAAISGLNNPRYAATAECLLRIDEDLLQNPQNFIGAIRGVFGGCENIFKLMYAVPRLDARTAGDRIGNDQQSLYKDHPNLQAVSAKTLEGFKQWINAAHFYRHEQGVEVPNQPAAEIAILLISQGLSYVRWLAALDKRLAQAAS